MIYILLLFGHFFLRLHESGLLLISCGVEGVSREGTPPLPRPPWLQSIAVVPRMCWGFWVAAILEACLTGPLCVCQMASVIGQLCPVTFGHCVPIVCAGEQTVHSLSQRVWEYYPKQHLSKMTLKQQSVNLWMHLNQTVMPHNCIFKNYIYTCTLVIHF